MRNIIRCPGCFTYVYSDARRCHGCGERLGKRKLLTRGSWVFIVLAVGGFAVARGIDMHQDKRQRIHREMEIAGETERVKAFVRQWLVTSPELLSGSVGRRKAFTDGLVALRNKFPEALPATSVGKITVRHDGYENHRQVGRGVINHEDEQWSPKLRVSAESSPDGVISAFRGKTSQRYWHSHDYEFEADLTKDGRSYTLHGKVCVNDATILCLAIDRIEGVEGIVKPVE